MKASRKPKSAVSNAKPNDIARQSPTINKLKSKDQLKSSTTNATSEAESKSLHVEEEIEDPDLMMKDLDSAYYAKNQEASTLDDLPSYNQLINNFENAELNEKEKFWSIDLEEIDPYKKIDLDSYFLNKGGQQQGGQQENGKKEANSPEQQRPKYAEGPQYQLKSEKTKKLERLAAVVKTTTTTAEPETTTLQQALKVEDEKEETLEGMEMQQYLEDNSSESELPVVTEEIRENLSENLNELSENVAAGRKFQPIANPGRDSSKANSNGRQLPANRPSASQSRSSKF